MKINLIAVGKSMPAWINTGFKEYIRRLPNNFKLNLIEINPAKRTASSDIKRILTEENKRILEYLPQNNLIIALDEHGKNWDTLTLAKYLQTWHENQQEISFIIGGPDGLAKECLKNADLVWSLSPLTFPHSLVRIIVAEQIYRAWTILQKHPYHRA